MKKNKLIILLALCLLNISSYANSVYNDMYNKELIKLSRDIYITQEQARLLMIRYNKEKEKSFNNRTVQSCITALKGLKRKEVSLIKQKNNYIRLNNHQVRIEREKKDKYKNKINIKRNKKKKQLLAKKNIPKKISKNNGKIKVNIDLSQQRMFVYKGNNLLYTWLVSTARKGYNTPRGNYKPYHLAKMHYSTLYNNSPMPYSIFFKGGYAIHGTNSIKRLGRRASHGCIRLHPSNAKKLYNLVRNHGYKRTSIKIRS